MALYEYECCKCGTTMEKKQNIASDANRLLYCPKCRRIRSVKRLISKNSFILNGAWAKDGYTKEKI